MISWQAKSLWAKKAYGNQDEQWLPLAIHMSDSAETARLLWHHWLPFCTKDTIARGLGEIAQGAKGSKEVALSCFVFLAAGHDLGKAIPAFQGKLQNVGLDEHLRKQLTDAGLHLRDNIRAHETRHYWASQLILERYGFNRKLAVVVGGHHGQPPNHMQLDRLRTDYNKDLGWGKGQNAWERVQHELLIYALRLAGISEQEAQSWQPDITAQVLLSGLVIMVDWIVSNRTNFPHIDLPAGIKKSTQRAGLGWSALSLPECWSPDNAWEWMGDEFFERRFNIKRPRPVQTAIMELSRNVFHPGIVIIEAPMGEGKTEAALAAAEIMANRTKRSGLFFALPTQASANGMFLRFCNWIERLDDDVVHTVKLAHGKADLNELYKKIPRITDEIESFCVGGQESEETYDDAIIVHDWFSGRKKGILAEFVMGTIDQVLMGALKQKHLALRHLGLANKVVVLDECHAYDAYMSQYLYKVLNWLGAYKVPVIVLSATLPGEKRQHLIQAYLNKEIVVAPEYDPVFDKEKPEDLPIPLWANTCDYPIITYNDGCDVRQETVRGIQRSLDVIVEVLSDDEQIVLSLKDLLSEGGCAGIIVNTVKRAQRIAHILNRQFGEGQVHLLHSRFVAIDRSQKEKRLFAKLGTGGERPQRCIVVGTQIFEQSCDLDFDVLVTDICPMDLLIQRIGRLHRHQRTRPPKLFQAKCFITGMYEGSLDRGAELVYGKYLLMNTRALLPPKITLPFDIPQLVQETYSSNGVPVPLELQREYEDAKSRHSQLMADKVNKAQGFQISDPYKRLDDLIGWLDTSIMADPLSKRGEATVRDTLDSLEVLVVQRVNNTYRMLPWLSKYGGQEIPADMAPDTGLAQAIAECSIQLPHELFWNIDKAIEELETIALRELRAWQQSPWLKGELFLILDRDLVTEFCGYRLQYDQCYGISAKRIEEGDGNAGEGIQLIR